MAHHLINLLVILRDIGEGKVKPVMFLGQVKAFPDTGEHTQSQNIYLQEAQRFNIILVPFYTRPVCHPCIHNGQRSESRSRVITNPPVCCPSCLGKPIYSQVSSSTLRRCASRGSKPCEDGTPFSSHSSVNSYSDFESLSTASKDNPIAFPTSRTAPFQCT